jgi:hypothetical protein
MIQEVDSVSQRFLLVLLRIFQHLMTFLRNC